MISGIHISSSQLQIQKGGAVLSRQFHFKKNQVVSATVLKLLPEGKALLQVAGQTVTARTALLLTPGEDLRLKVMQSGDDMILKLIPPEKEAKPGRAQSLARLFANAKIGPRVPEGLAGFSKKMLTELSVKSRTADPQFLPRLIEKGGLLFEQKLAQFVGNASGNTPVKTALGQLINQDLRAVLLQQLQVSGSGSEPGRAVMSVLEHLESFAQVNHSGQESNRYLFPFPILDDNGFRFGQLLVDTGRGKADAAEHENKSVVNVSFLLEMSNLGALRADFSILKKAIYGRFLLKDDDTCAYAGALMPELKKRLSVLGYEVGNIECRPAQADMLEPNCLVDRLLKSGENTILNIVV